MHDAGNARLRNTRVRVLSHHAAQSLLAGAAISALLGWFGQCQSGSCPLTSRWWRGALYGGFVGLLIALSSGTRPAS